MPALALRLRLLWMTQHNRKQEVLASGHVSVTGLGLSGMFGSNFSCGSYSVCTLTLICVQYCLVKVGIEGVKKTLNVLVGINNILALCCTFVPLSFFRVKQERCCQDGRQAVTLRSGPVLSHML